MATHDRKSLSVGKDRSGRQTPKPETAIRFQAAMSDLACAGRPIGI
jgi:hypothetical protein